MLSHARARAIAATVVFSSVAGDRARKPVGLYGAAKAGLAHYLESVDLRYGARGLRVLIVKPGFVRTGITKDADHFKGRTSDEYRYVLDRPAR